MSNDIVSAVFQIAVLLFSVVLHEVSHGAMAYRLGDPTAKYQGRLTLNPIKHLDPVGSVLVPGLLLITSAPFVFGWAKPVPVNSYNLRDQRWGGVKVALAGPFSNIGIALIFGLLLRFVALPEQLSLFFMFIVLINLVLAVFNLIPIPPLDGSHVLFALLPDRYYNLKVQLQQYGFVLVLALLFFGGLSFVFGIVTYLFRLIVGQGLFF